MQNNDLHNDNRKNKTESEPKKHSEGFQRARTKEQKASRQEEIVNACAKLFEEGGFDAVSFKTISDMTSFSRQSIYKYYNTKEEVLLDLLKREQRQWERDMYEALYTYPTLPKEDYAMMLTGLFSAHGAMLQLISLLFNVLEMNCSLEKLVEFRGGSVDVYHILLMSVTKYFPNAPIEHTKTFAATVFALAIGLFPMNHMSAKQLEAERLANNAHLYPEGYQRETFFETSFYASILMLLESF